MSTLYDKVMQQVKDGMCQEDFIKNPDAHIERLNGMTNEDLLLQISWALEKDE